LSHCITAKHETAAQRPPTDPSPNNEIAEGNLSPDQLSRVAKTIGIEPMSRSEFLVIATAYGATIATAYATLGLKHLALAHPGNPCQRQRRPPVSGPRKAKVALARKLAVTLHAMWRTNTPFREVVMA